MIYLRLENVFKDYQVHFIFYSARKSDFTLGWDNNANTLNDYQMRKKKNNDVVGKITEKQFEIPKPPQKYNYSSEVNNYDDPRLL